MNKIQKILSKLKTNVMWSDWYDELVEPNENGGYLPVGVREFLLRPDVVEEWFGKEEIKIKQTLVYAETKEVFPPAVVGKSYSRYTAYKFHQQQLVIMEDEEEMLDYYLKIGKGGGQTVTALRKETKE